MFEGRGHFVTRRVTRWLTWPLEQRGSVPWKRIEFRSADHLKRPYNYRSTT